MAVFRVERTGNYTVMSNYHLRDKRLSLKAKGLLSQMLSLPEDWDYTLAGLARINAEGKDAIRAAVVELERAGYVQRRQTTDRAGKFAANEYLIRERPASCPSREAPPEGLSPAFPLPETPAAAEPPAAFTGTEKAPQLKKDPPRTEHKIRTSQSTKSASSPSAPLAAPRERAPEAKGRKRTRDSGVSREEMDACREWIRENVDYRGFVRDRPLDAPRLDEMVELMVEAVCSRKARLRVAGNDLPQAAVRDRLLELDGEHLRFVFDCLRENTTRVRNVKQYLLAVLYNAPATMESYYAARVSHDWGGGAA